MDKVSDQAWIIADTNYFLHFQPPDQIDWKSLTDSKEVVLVIPMTVIKELDKHKNSSSSKVRSKAQNIISKLKQINQTQDKAWGSGVRLQLAPKIAVSSFVELDLDESQPDDQIIAFVTIFSKREGIDSSLVYLVSNDFGMELKAGDHQIKLLAIPEKYKLGPELDANEKELRDLKKQNAELLNRMPKLAIEMNEEGRRIESSVSNVSALTEEEIEEKLSEIRVLYPLHSERLPDVEKLLMIEDGMNDDEKLKVLSKNLANVFSLNRAMGSFGPSQSQWDEYNAELERFYDEYRNYIKKENDYEQLLERSVFIDFYLRNDGTTPANDVRINLLFPNGPFILVDGSDFSDEPKKPAPPKVPRFQKLSDFTFERQMFVPDYADLIRNAEKINVRNTDIERGDKVKVSSRVHKAMHGKKEFLRTVVVVFDSAEDARSFSIECELVCDELIQVSSSQLHVVFKGKKC